MSVGIIGGGVIGLLSALTLTDAGYSVTVVSRELPGDDSQKWASAWAGAGILPHPDFGGHDLIAEAFKFYWALAHRDPTSGVQVVDVTEYYDDRDDDASIWYKRLVPKYRRLPATDLPSVAKVGFQYQSMAVNPDVFLPWLKAVLDKRGVRFLHQEVQSMAEARSLLKTDVVVNASGLGARTLASDQRVLPIRGQTMLVESDSHEIVMLQGTSYTYQIPRMYSGGVIIGGVSHDGSTDGRVDPETRTDILARINQVTNGRFKTLDLEKNVIKDIVAFRPGRDGGFRLETEGDVVHAYGFHHLGYTYSYGAALKVAELVQSVLGQEKSAQSKL